MIAELSAGATGYRILIRRVSEPDLYCCAGTNAELQEYVKTIVPGDTRAVQIECDTGNLEVILTRKNGAVINLREVTALEWVRYGEPD